MDSHPFCYFLLYKYTNVVCTFRNPRCFQHLSRAVDLERSASGVSPPFQFNSSQKHTPRPLHATVSTNTGFIPRFTSGVLSRESLTKIFCCRGVPPSQRFKSHRRCDWEQFIQNHFSHTLLRRLLCLDRAFTVQLIHFQERCHSRKRPAVPVSTCLEGQRFGIPSNETVNKFPEGHNWRADGKLPS